MCLLVTHKQPYNDSKIRYKILKKRPNENYYSPFQETYWENNELTAVNPNPSAFYAYIKDSTLSQRGIHVFVKATDAQKCNEIDMDAMKTLDAGKAEYVVVSVEVSGFLDAGENHNVGEYANGKQAETWVHAKIIQEV